MNPLDEAKAKLAAIQENPPEEILPRPDYSYQADRARWEAEQAAAEPRYSKPEGIVGEFGAGVERGFLQTGQMAAGAGAALTGAMGMEGVSGALRETTMGLGREIAKHPASIDDFTQINDVGDAGRYAAATLGEFVPQVAEMFALGGAGGILTRGFLRNTLGRGAARALVAVPMEMEEATVVTKELADYASGKIARKELGDTAEKLVQGRALDWEKRAARWGANFASTAGSVEMEVGSIYADLAPRTDLAESDKIKASIVGGLSAGMVESPLNHYIWGKFFPGRPPESLTPAEREASLKFWNKFVTKFAPAMATTTSGEAVEEWLQTGIEIASAHWADPAKRARMFDMSDKEALEQYDAAIRGGVGGGLMGAPTAVASMIHVGPIDQGPPHPNPEVRTSQRSLERAQKDVAVIPKANKEDIRISEIQNELKDLSHAETTAQPDEIVKIGERRAELQAEYDSLTKEPSKTETKAAEDKAEMSKYEALVSEPTEAIKARTKDETEFKAALEGRQEAVKKVAESLEPGDVIVDPKGMRHTVREVQPDGGIVTEEGATTNLYAGDKIERKAKVEADKTAAGITPDRKPTVTDKELEKVKKEYQKIATKNVATQGNYPGKAAKETATRKNIGDVILQSTANSKNPEIAKRQAEERRKVMEDQAVVDYAAREGIVYRLQTPDETKAQKAKQAAGLAQNEYSIKLENGKITIAIPHVDYSFDEDILKSPEQIRLKHEQTPKSVYHELLHSAQYVALRDKFFRLPKSDQNNKTKYPDGWESYVALEVRALGKSLRKAFGGLDTAKSTELLGNDRFARLLRKVYEMESDPSSMEGDTPSEKERNLNELVGDETMRMALELSRTGELSEVTEAMIQAARDNESTKKGDFINDLLSRWFDVLKTIKKALTNLISGESVSPEFLQMWKEVSNTLDRYGLLIPETTTEEAAIARSKELTKELGPKVTKETKKESPPKAASPKVEPRVSESIPVVPPVVGDESPIESKAARAWADALPVGAVVRDVKTGEIFKKESDGEFRTNGGNYLSVTSTPVQLIVLPSEKKPSPKVKKESKVKGGKVPSVQAGAVYDLFVNERRVSRALAVKQLGLTPTEVEDAILELERQGLIKNYNAKTGKGEIGDGVPPKQSAGAKKRKMIGADNRRALELLGQSMYAKDLPKTVGKEVLQNAVDAVQKNTGDKRIIYGTLPGNRFAVRDNGPGMSLDIVLDKFLPAFVSGKKVGEGGGFGLAKIAFLGGPSQWQVKTISKNDDGTFTIIEIIGTGRGYLEYADNPPEIELVAGQDIQISSEIVLNYKVESGDFETGTSEIFTFKPEESNYEAAYFLDKARDYIPDVEFHYVSDSDTDPHGLISVGERSPVEPLGVIHSVSLKQADIDIIAPQGSKMQKTSYIYVPVLNRGILQFDTSIQLKEQVLLPRDIAVNIKPKTKAGTKDYPFSTNREQITDQVKNEVAKFFNNAGKRAIDELNKKYADSKDSSPPIGKTGMWFLDAGSKVPEDVMKRIAGEDTTEMMLGDIRNIQGAILNMLKRKYPGRFNRATMEGLLTGGNAYGVHFGKRDQPSVIYHDPWLSWNMAKSEVMYFMEETQKLENRAIVREDIDFYTAFLSKIAGVSLHEALHQEVSSEGEPLSRELTFKAGDIIDAVIAFFDVPHTHQELAKIISKLDENYETLVAFKDPEEATQFYAAHGYEGYSISRLEKATGGTEEDTGGREVEEEPSLTKEEKPDETAGQSSETTGQSNLTAEVEKNISDAQMMAPDDPIGFLRKMADSARQQGKEEAAQNFESAISSLTKVPPKRPAGSMTRFSNPEKAKFKNLVNDVNVMLRGGISELPQKVGKMRIRGTVHEMIANVDPTILWYQQAPITESKRFAMGEMDKVDDIMEAAMDFWRDPWMKSLGIIEDSLDSAYGGKVAAYGMELLIRLNSVANMMDAADFSVGARIDVREMARMVEEAMKRQGTEGGQYNVTLGKINMIWNRIVARNKLSDTLFHAADDVLGKGAKEKLEDLARQINEELKKAAPAAAMSSGIIKLLRDAFNLINKSNFKTLGRRNIANTVKAMKKVTAKAAARMASQQAYSEDSQAKANTVIAKLVKAMQGIAKGTGEIKEEDLFLQALEKFVAEYGKRMKMIVPKVKTRGTSIDQMVAILKNPTFYQQFADTLTEAYDKAYLHDNPSDEQLKQSSQLKDFMFNKGWKDDLVKEVVNEKFREHNVNLAKLLADTYRKAGEVRNEVADEIKKYLEEKGITDTELVNEMVELVEGDINERIEKQSKIYFGQAKTLKEFLADKQKTLSQMVNDLSSTKDIHSSFKQTLMEDYFFPEDLAIKVAKVMSDELYGLTAAENQRVIDNFLKKNAAGIDDKKKKRVRTAISKVRQAISLGVFHSEDYYHALQEEFDLPKWDAKMAEDVEELGELWAESSTDRQKQKIDQILTNLLAKHKGFSTWAAYESWMYASMLSALGTHARNVLGNVSNLAGFFQVEAVKAIAAGQPNRVIQMIKALLGAMGGKGQLEMREAWFTGMHLGKDDQKWIARATAFETADPFFKSHVTDWPWLKGLDESFATFVHWLGRKMGGQLVGRALIASDNLFRIAGQEMAYVRRVGPAGAMVTDAMWRQAVAEARRDIAKLPQKYLKAGGDIERQVKVLAHSIIDHKRLKDPNSGAAWSESIDEGMEITFTQEPKGILGAMHRAAKLLAKEFPPIKAIIPFTQVAANIANMLLDWTPYGLIRYGLGHYYGDDFRLKDKNGKVVGGFGGRNHDIAIRAGLGVLWTVGLMMMAARFGDDDDPFFMIYGNGPRDLEARRLLRERGWKPNSVKIGQMYFSYLQNPLAMALSIAGKQFDDYRDGKIANIGELRLATWSVALMEAVKEQSFIATATDLASSVDGPNPEKNVARVMSRTTTLFLPNVFKSVDKWLDPSIQDADGFWEQWLKEIPVVRHVLKDSLNTFGQPIKRSKGLINLPSMENIIGMQKTDDPVLNFMSETRSKIPGYSAGTRINNKPIGQHRYEYVEIAGPRIYEQILVNSPYLRTLTKEERDKEIDKISRDEKERARREIEAKYPDDFKD